MNTRAKSAVRRSVPNMKHPWTPVWDAPRPFVHPVCTPSGTVLSNNAPDDHPWHHGLWSTIKFLNGDNFWEEYGDFGTLRTASVIENAATVTAEIDWLRPDGETVAARETRAITEVPIDAYAYALDWTVSVVPTVDTVFDRTPFTVWGGYSGLTLRGAANWVDTTLALPDGRDRDRVLGDRGQWCALRGPRPGSVARDDVVGIAMFDHPRNPNHPTPWYASTRADTYGEGWANFCNAAFLWDAPIERAARTPLVLRHRVVIHDGQWSHQRVQDAYDAWCRGD